MDVTLLGPQRRTAAARAAVRDLMPDGPIAAVSAGWQERESETDELNDVLGGRMRNLGLYRRWQQLITDDPAAVSWLRHRGLIGLCAHQLGVTQRALELTAAYATERVQFGRPIGTFQAVAQRLADAYIDVQAIELTMWQAAWRFASRR